MTEILLNSTIVITILSIWIHVFFGICAILYSDKHYPNCVVNQTDSVIGVFIVVMIWPVAVPYCIARYKHAPKFNHLNFDHDGNYRRSSDG